MRRAFRIGSLRQPRVCIDLRERALYWARAVPDGSGMKPVAYGSVAMDSGQPLATQLEAVASSGIARGARVDFSLVGQEAAHQRIAVPALSRREASVVAERRAARLRAEAETELCDAWSRAVAGDRGALWLSQVPTEVALSQLESWESWGFQVARLRSRPFALGNLARILPHPEDGPIAIIDLEPQYGTCVIADRLGWVFSREIPVRFMGERMLRSEKAGVEGLVADSLQGDASLELADADESEDLDPLEQIADQAERLATELRRTFQYVKGELDLGVVRGVFLSGEDPCLPQLPQALSETLKLPVALAADSYLDEALVGAPGGACVVIGMALDPDRLGGNLLPREVLEARQQARSKRMLLAAVTLTILVLAIGGGFLTVNSAQLREAAARLDQAWSQHAQRRGLVQEVRAARSRSGEIRALLDLLERPEPSWTALLEVLGRLAPDEMAVHQLTASSGDGAWRTQLMVESSGRTVAEAARAVSEFARRIDEAPLLRLGAVEREARVRQATSDESRAVVRYRIEAQLAPLAAAGAALSESAGAPDV